MKILVFCWSLAVYEVLTIPWHDEQQPSFRRGFAY